MSSLQNNNFISEIIIGVIFFSIGIYILLNRKKVITALLSSQKVFWGKMGFKHGFFHKEKLNKFNEKATKFSANIMIPIMGVVFLATGVLQICKVIIIYMK